MTKQAWKTIRLGMVVTTIITGMVLYSNHVKANIFVDAFDAITGHVEDIEGRINHNDAFIDGETLATNEFRRDDIGRDGIHWANGTASIVLGDSTRYIQLHEDFTTGPAPDLYIYLASERVVDEASFWAADRIEIGKLDSGSGAQYYEIPEATTHTELVVWCKRFGAFIGATTLNTED